MSIPIIEEYNNFVQVSAGLQAIKLTGGAPPGEVARLEKRAEEHFLAWAKAVAGGGGEKLADTLEGIREAALSNKF